MIVNNLTKTSKNVFFKSFLGLLFLFPIGLEISGERVSANYLFVIPLLWAILTRKNFFKTNTFAINYYFGYSLLLFFLAPLIILLFYDVETSLRGIFSGLIFLSSLALIYKRFDYTLDGFLNIVLFAGVGYSIYAIWGFLVSGYGLVDMAFLKAGLRDFIVDWPQRYIIIVMLSFFIAWRDLKKSQLYILIIILLISVIILSYTRAVWLSLLIGVLFTVSFKFDHRSIRQFVIFAVLSLFLYYRFIDTFNEIFHGFNILFDQSSSVVSEGASNLDDESSEGSRLLIWKKIISYVIFHPLGSGFLGAAFVIDYGASHNQYFDVLLRTGWIGLFFYLYVWHKMFHFFWSDRHIRGALISLFIFGFFHETTKLSYGAYFFFSLAAYVFQNSKNKRVVQKN